MGALISRMAAMVSLAAAIGVPMQYLYKGQLPEVIIAGMVVCIQQLTGYYSMKSKSFYNAANDIMSVMLKDGQLQLSDMEQTRLTHERLFSQLRHNQIRPLGQVHRVYLEASGEFSILKNKEEKPGLSIFPDRDTEFRNRKQKQCSDRYACCYCGNLQKPEQPPPPCNHCHKQEWEMALLNKTED